jgi:hypothetical protein
MDLIRTQIKGLNQIHKINGLKSIYCNKEELYEILRAPATLIFSDSRLL